MMSETAKIALATLDGEIYFKAVQELKIRKTRFITRKPGETIPLSVKAVITTENESTLVKHHTVLVCRKNDVEEIVNRAIDMIRGTNSQPQKVVIGVDPGKTTGFAVLSGGVIIKTSNHSTLTEILDTITKTVKDLNPKELTVKIGKATKDQWTKKNTEPEDLSREINKLTNSLAEEFNLNAKVIFVDERYTTAIAKRNKVRRRERDKTSAVEIALR